MNNSCENVSAVAHLCLYCSQQVSSVLAHLYTELSVFIVITLGCLQLSCHYTVLDSGFPMSNYQHGGQIFTFLTVTDPNNQRVNTPIGRLSILLFLNDSFTFSAFLWFSSGRVCDFVFCLYVGTDIFVDPYLVYLILCTTTRKDRWCGLDCYRTSDKTLKYAILYPVIEKQRVSQRTIGFTSYLFF